MLSVLIFKFKDIELSEDALQEAVIVALEKWPADGIPPNPLAWLMRTASRKAIDRFRREQNFSRKSEEIRVLQEIMNPGEITQNMDFEVLEDNQIPDERLRLIFTCCHPSLSKQVRVSLTLKTLCGLTTQQVANAYVVSEETMAQRLVRAKKKIKSAGIPYQIPPAHLLDERLSAVLSVIYFIFNEGYRASIGEELINSEFCDEAIHLANTLYRLLPGETEILGYLRS